MSHLTNEEIGDLIYAKWKCKVSAQEKKEFEQQAKKEEERYYEEHEAAKAKINDLRK